MNYLDMCRCVSRLAFLLATGDTTKPFGSRSSQCKKEHRLPYYLACRRKQQLLTPLARIRPADRGREAPACRPAHSSSMDSQLSTSLVSALVGVLAALLAQSVHLFAN